LSRLRILSLTVAGTAVAIILLMAVGAVVGSTTSSDGLAVFSYIVIPFIFVLAAWITARTLHVEGWATIIGHNTSVRSTLTHVAAAFCLAIGLKVGLSFITAVVAYIQNPEEQLAAARAAAQTARIVLFRWPGMSLRLMRSLVGSAVSEELLVRGCLLSLYERWEVAPFRIGKIVLDGPNVMSSIAFALFHLVNGDETVLTLLGIFAISLFLGRAKRKTGGLLVPMLCHSVFNFVPRTMFQIVKI